MEQCNRNKKGQFIKGHNLAKGRPRGKRNFKTDFEIAAREVAEALRLGKEPDKVQIEIIKRGIRESLAGNYPFWKDVVDRLYGKVVEKIEGKIRTEIEQRLLTEKEAKRAQEIDKLLKNYVRGKSKYPLLDTQKRNKKRKGRLN